ncbi:hypothetical protein K1T71_000280 [Dendrolimus kikuchii]|uniref:Uncharacterized protein n=1 Tax=Dendrolimus kikuchii TaxID=765133 RepID=A0ACC1DIX5_9NEOP|nr:hypothetical protein K1T71_000280 [Dendrolimus kikuchii]
MNKTMAFAGVATLFQAAGQMIFTALGLAQHFCVIDFLREFPLLIYIRILYFHNPNSCGNSINIGQAIDEIANPAFVLLTNVPFTAFRTFVINSISLGLSFFWIISSVIIMIGGAKGQQSKHRRWPWITITVAVCSLDLVATVTYANDSFHTRTLSDVMNYIGGVASGLAGVQLDTSWAAWLMVLLYSRFVVLFTLNLLLVVTVILNYNVKPEIKLIESFVEMEAPIQTHVDAATETSNDVPATIVVPVVNVNGNGTVSIRDVEEASIPSESVVETTKIPRPGLSQSFKRMKEFLFKRTPSPVVRGRLTLDSIDGSPERSPQTQHIDMDKKRTVNFPENLLSLPQRLENMIAEQQRRLDQAVIDTAGRRTPPRASQSMPQLHQNPNQPETTQGRRSTRVELQGQLPWAYIPASAHPMRDQLPPDEDLPPVPLPDYTAIQSFRKASVHRAASSLSSLIQKKEYTSSQPNRESVQPARPAKFKTGANLQLLPIFKEN